MTPLRVISLGAGVQSSTVYLLACAGELGRVDAAVFADTGWEPRAVYEHLDRLEAFGGATVPIHRVSSGNIRDTERQKDFYDAPYFLLSDCGACGGSGKRGWRFSVDDDEPLGSEEELQPFWERRWRLYTPHPPGDCYECKGSGVTFGMARRQCTHQLKLRPIRTKLNELREAAGISKEPGCVESLIGISLDEVQRMKDSDVKWNVNGYPLIDRRWSRADCKAYLAAIGWSAPRSACIGCPFHSDAEWRDLKNNSPDEFADAVAFEREIQATNAGLRGKPFLHASRRPLDLVDFATAEDRGQLNFDAECEGMCGV